MKSALHINPEGQVLCFDKPLNWTSFDVVKKVRGLLNGAKVGHAGTLDPLATGLLILCSGKKTKIISQIQEQPKEYIAEITLGATTASFDAEFPPENPIDCNHITLGLLEKAIHQFIGEIEQVPPQFSAIKVNGKPAYKAARKGKKVLLKPRKIFIYAFELLEFTAPNKLKTRIECSKGTYIRTIAHDLGQVLGVGAYLSQLTRTKIGTYSLKDAWQIEEFEEAIRKKDESF